MWWANVKIFRIFRRFLCGLSRFCRRILILKRVLSYIYQVLSFSDFSGIEPKIFNIFIQKRCFETFELFSIIIQAQKSNSIAHWIETFSKHINPSGNTFNLSGWNTESEWPLSEVDGVSGSLKELKFRGKYRIILWELMFKPWNCLYKRFPMLYFFSPECICPGFWWSTIWWCLWLRSIIIWRTWIFQIINTQVTHFFRQFFFVRF